MYSPWSHGKTTPCVFGTSVIPSSGPTAWTHGLEWSGGTERSTWRQVPSMPRLLVVIAIILPIYFYVLVPYAVAWALFHPHFSCRLGSGLPTRPSVGAASVPGVSMGQGLCGRCPLCAQEHFVRLQAPQLESLLLFHAPLLWPQVGGHRWNLPLPPHARSGARRGRRGAPRIWEDENTWWKAAERSATDLHLAFLHPNPKEAGRGGSGSEVEPTR